MLLSAVRTREGSRFGANGEGAVNHASAAQERSSHISKEIEQFSRWRQTSCEDCYLSLIDQNKSQSTIR